MTQRFFLRDGSEIKEFCESSKNATTDVEWLAEAMPFSGIGLLVPFGLLVEKIEELKFVKIVVLGGVDL
jgi:hypothetical protein